MEHKKKKKEDRKKEGEQKYINNWNPRKGDAIETKKRRKISETIEIIEWATDEDRKIFIDSHDIKVSGEINFDGRKKRKAILE